MDIPINELSLLLSILLALAWLAIKFVKKHRHPCPEDVLDLIFILMLGPVIAIGAMFILFAFGFVELIALIDFKLHVGISGMILMGASIYFYYVALVRRARIKQVIL